MLSLGNLACWFQTIGGFLFRSSLNPGSYALLPYFPKQPDPVFMLQHFADNAGFLPEQFGS
jgi:hypothetical protein